MILVDTSGIDAFCLAAERELARLDREISEAFYTWTWNLFKELVTATPQWSGDLAANWNYSVGTPDMSYRQILNKTGDEPGIDHWRENQGVFQRGDWRAVEMALARAQGKRPTWRDTVYFTNATPIAQQVEDESIRIRPVNLVAGHVVMARQLALKYGAQA